MQNFHDIIAATEFDGVWGAMESIYSGIEQYKDNFSRIFDFLKAAVPDENQRSMSISICEKDEPFFLLGDEEEEDSGEAEYQAVGLVPGDDDYYSIGSLPEETIAGLFVPQDMTDKYSPAEIVAYTMSEITYFYSAVGAAWGKEGVMDATVCGGDTGTVSINDYRREIGASTETPKTGVDRFF